MINKRYIKKQKINVFISLTILSGLLIGCGKNITIETQNTETHTETEPNTNLDTSNRSLFDLFPSDFNNDDSDFNKDDSLTSDSNENDSFENNDNNTYSHTIMVYMVGSDLESNYGHASRDLDEMLNAQPDLDNNNIVIFTGGASKWQLQGIDSNKNYILEFKDDYFYAKDELKRCNMGESESLSNFITYCLDEYNTDKYSLILWNHGAGPVTGFGLDENYSDILTLPELHAALQSSVGKSDKKLELIGFDACLMSSLEIAGACAPYANYLVSSQETEPGWGWNYEFLSKLSDSGMNGAGLGKEIIDAYMDYSEQMFDYYPESQSDLTLSCIDLTKYDDVEESLGEFFNDINNKLSVTTLPEIIRTRNRIRDFGSYSSDFSYSLIDTVQLVEQLCDNDNKNSAQKALENLDEMIIYSQTNMSDVNGISICFPNNTTEQYKEAYLSVNKHFDFSPKYTNFLKNLYALQDGETIVSDWDISDAETSVENEEITEADITSNGSNISIQLTQEQQANFAGASFYILGNAKALGYKNAAQNERSEDMYLSVYVGKNVQMDDDGKLHALYDNNLLYMICYDDEGNSELSNIPMILHDNDITNTTEKRYTSHVILSNISDDVSEYSSAKAAKLQIIREKEHPDGYVRSAISVLDGDEKIQTPDKQLLDLKDFNSMQVYSGYARYVTKDSDGNTLPYSEWEKSSWLFGFESYIDKGITFKSMSIPDPENYACMFVIYDSQGNTISSELIPLK